MNPHPITSVVATPVAPTVTALAHAPDEMSEVPSVAVLLATVTVIGIVFTVLPVPALTGSVVVTELPSSIMLELIIEFAPLALDT